MPLLIPCHHRSGTHRHYLPPFTVAVAAIYHYQCLLSAHQHHRCHNPQCHFFCPLPMPSRCCSVYVAIAVHQISVVVSPLHQAHPPSSFPRHHSSRYHHQCGPLQSPLPQASFHRNCSPFPGAIIAAASFITGRPSNIMTNTFSCLPPPNQRRSHPTSLMHTIKIMQHYHAPPSPLLCLSSPSQPLHLHHSAPCPLLNTTDPDPFHHEQPLRRWCFPTIIAAPEVAVAVLHRSNLQSPLMLFPVPCGSKVCRCWHPTVIAARRP